MIKIYVRDDIHFFSYIPQKTDPDTLMVIFDNRNLHSNIFHELEKQIISFWIEKYPETLHPIFNKKNYI